MNKIKAIVRLLFVNTLYLAYLIIPKKNSRVLFAQSNNRYASNSRYLFEYLVEKNVEAFWLYSSKEQLNNIPAQYHLNAIKLRSIKGIYLGLSSKFFVVSHGYGDFNILFKVLNKGYVLNVWHAIMLKHTALLDEGLSENIKNKVVKKWSRYCDAFTTSSDIDRYLTSASHGIDSRKVYASGNPKTDHYINSLHLKNKTLNKKILYAPTFRDYELKEDLFFPFSDFSIEKLKQYFSKNSQLQIYLRPHPNDKKSVNQAEKLELEFPNNIVHFSQQVCDDIDEVLYQFDTVITDYSSIYIEPLLGDTPCIFVPFDYDCYMETRGLAYDYEMVTPGPKVRSFAEFLEAVEDALQGAQDWKIKRKLVTDIFFKYKDANACERIATEVLGLDIPTAKSEKINR